MRGSWGRSALVISSASQAYFADVRRGFRPAAFTLIELLVVVGIISLLISILTPSLARARQQAKSTVCMATQNEMMKGLIAYGSDYHFALPPAHYELKKAPTTDVAVRHGWAEALYRTLYSADDFSRTEDFPVLHNREGRFSFWVCKEAEPRADSTGHYRVYQYAWSKGRLDSIFHRLPLITDANPLVTDPNDLRRADIPSAHLAGLDPEAFIDERHYGGAVYSFRDGHCERSTTLKRQLALDWDLDPNTPQ